ncbi:MAG: hypothetical protein RLO45_26205 [Roseovarius indicus]
MDDPALLRQQESTTPPLAKLDPQSFFERSDVVGDRRLTETELNLRRGNAAVTNDAVKDGKEVQFCPGDLHPRIEALKPRTQQADNNIDGLGRSRPVGADI